jgi:hypothetical protein
MKWCLRVVKLTASHRHNDPSLYALVIRERERDGNGKARADTSPPRGDASMLSNLELLVSQMAKKPSLSPVTHFNASECKFKHVKAPLTLFMLVFKHLFFRSHISSLIPVVAAKYLELAENIRSEISLVRDDSLEKGRDDRTWPLFACIRFMRFPFPPAAIT